MDNTEPELLLVGDNMSDAELIIQAFQKNKIATRITHLKDSTSAFNFLFGKAEFSERNTGYKPRLILLDLKIHSSETMEFLEKIKSDELTRKIPLVVLTSSREYQNIEKAYSLGVNSYIIKPSGFEDLSRIIAEVGLYWMIRNQQ
jgi:two-component system, response regulator